MHMLGEGDYRAAGLGSDPEQESQQEQEPEPEKDQKIESQDSCRSSEIVYLEQEPEPGKCPDCGSCACGSISWSCFGSGSRSGSCALFLQEQELKYEGYFRG